MASRSLGSLSVDLVLKLGGFTQGMDKAARESEKSLNRIRKAAGGLGTAITAGLGVLAGAGLFRGIVQNTTEAENALRQLEARLKSTGGVSGVTSEELQDFAQSMQSVTTFGDDAIIAMQSLLLSFTNIRGPQVYGATEAILNLATAMGTDLNSAALQVGKALNDPIKGISALGRAGVQFTDEQEKLIKSLVKTGDTAGAQTVILKELETQFGGSARAAANTFGGALTQLQNAFGDLLEVNGGGLNDATDAVQEFTAALSSPAIKEGAQTLSGALLTAISALSVKTFEFAGGIKVLAENFAAMRAGAAADDLVRLNEQLALATELREAGAQSLLTGGAFFDRLRFFGKDGLVEWYDDAELDAEIASLKRQIEEGTSAIRPPLLGASGSPSSGGSGSGGGSAAAASDEYSKLSAKLREQIALYGQTSEAAKLSYAIQTGAIEGLNEGEAQRLLGLARQLDALNANAEAAKQQSEALKQFNKELEASIAEGIEAQELDALKALEAESDRYFATLERGRAITEAMRTPQEQYADSIMELNDLLAQGAIEQETYARAVEAAQDDVIAAVKTADDQWTVFRDQAARNTQDILADTLVSGFDDGAKGVLDSFGKMLQQMAAQAVAADIASKLFGSGTPNTTSGGGGDYGWIGQLIGAFAGGFASGGTMQAGEWGIVGERGPELAYAGSAPLSIQPMTQGASNNNFNISIAAPSEQVGRLTAQQAATAVARQLAMAQRRNG